MSHGCFHANFMYHQFLHPRDIIPGPLLKSPARSPAIILHAPLAPSCWLQALKGVMRDTGDIKSAPDD